MVIATGRSEGDIVIRKVGRDSGESEWWVVRMESSVVARSKQVFDTQSGTKIYAVIW